MKLVKLKGNNFPVRPWGRKPPHHTSRRQAETKILPSARRFQYLCQPGPWFILILSPQVFLIGYPSTSVLASGLSELVSYSTCRSYRLCDVNLKLQFSLRAAPFTPYGDSSFIRSLSNLIQWCNLLRRQRYYYYFTTLKARPCLVSVNEGGRNFCFLTLCSRRQHTGFAERRLKSESTLRLRFSYKLTSHELISQLQSKQFVPLLKFRRVALHLVFTILGSRH